MGWIIVHLAGGFLILKSHGSNFIHFSADSVQFRRVIKDLPVKPGKSVVKTMDLRVAIIKPMWYSNSEEGP